MGVRQKFRGVAIRNPAGGVGRHRDEATTPEELRTDQNRFARELDHVTLRGTPRVIGGEADGHPQRCTVAYARRPPRAEHGRDGAHPGHAGRAREGAKRKGRILKLSNLYVPTLRDAPSDVQAASHALLLRAGYARQLMSGHFILLPLGVAVRARIVEVIREEMTRIGAQEFSFPAMHPADVWRRTGRWTSMGAEMFRLSDRKGADLALGMTHEELFADLARSLKSYRDLPQLWYQIQTKFRDEPRPRGGLLRTREFTMKDSYSFDFDMEGLADSFRRHAEAYERIFARLEVPAIPVDASSGMMGGTVSTEYMCVSEAGEDVIVVCSDCDYAANVEKASGDPPRSAATVSDAPLAVVETPGVFSVDEVSAHLDVPPERIIKSLYYVGADNQYLVVLRGDDQLSESKLAAAIGEEIRSGNPEEIKDALGAPPGSIGPVRGQQRWPSSLTVLVDRALEASAAYVCGANVGGKHLTGMRLDRDLPRTARRVDVRTARDGDACMRCGAALRVMPAIEVGHIFQLGDKYSLAFGVRVVDGNGEERVVQMGSYGIGVERLIATLIEVHHDEKGIVWPVAAAPWSVNVIPTGAGEALRVAAELSSDLRAKGIHAVVDDREGTLGSRLTDWELWGIPLAVIVGPRGLEAGTCDVKVRRSGDSAEVALERLVGEIASRLVGT